MKSQLRYTRRDHSVDYGMPSPYALAAAPELWRRAILNKERLASVASKMHLSYASAVGVCLLMKKFGGPPSPERLALVAMRIPDADNEFIAEVFGRTVHWAAHVRHTGSVWKNREPIPRHLEFIDSGYCDGDPTPEEILAMAKQLRLGREPSRERAIRVGLPHYRWSFNNGTFVPVCAT